MVEIRALEAEGPCDKCGGGARARWEHFGERGLWEGRSENAATWRRDLDVWDVGRAPAHTGGTGAPEAWLPKGPDGKGQMQTAGGFSAAWKLEAWMPGPLLGRNLGGAAGGRGGPHKLGLGEPVTVSGLWVQTVTTKPPTPNLPSEACPSLPRGWGGRTSPTLQS